MPQRYVTVAPTTAPPDGHERARARRRGSPSALERPMSAAPTRKSAAIRRNSAASPIRRKHERVGGEKSSAAFAPSTTAVSSSAAATQRWKGSAQGRTRIQAASAAEARAAARGSQYALSNNVSIRGAVYPGRCRRSGSHETRRKSSACR